MGGMFSRGWCALVVLLTSGVGSGVGPTYVSHAGPTPQSRPRGRLRGVHLATSWGF